MCGKKVNITMYKNIEILDMNQNESGLLKCCLLFCGNLNTIFCTTL